MDMQSKSLNRLAQASSPYLLQHAHNPVDWYEWGEEALNKAKQENKPLLISIGYSACHWCHVMAHESFSDKAVAEVMNAHFVCIKVDREERPDLDQIYIEASQLLNGNAGWPLNVFALPDGRPFWVGMYFNKTNWMRVVQQLHLAYTEKNEVIIEQAEALTKGVAQGNMINLDVDAPVQFSPQGYNNLFVAWKNNIDFEKGGFQGSQKFPMVAGWEYILQHYYLTKNAKALAALEKTLEAMAFGGIYDQIGGGFSRYTVDEDWFAPHFEKMLYDNAQLVSLYVHAYQLTKNELYAQVIRETLAFVEREMTADNGGFYASLNADSEGEEGKYYVWTASEIDQVLTAKEATVFKAYYQITTTGNWERSTNILHCQQTVENFAQEKNLSFHTVEELLKAGKEKLLAERQKRVRPSTDDKILVAWNALMQKAYIEAYQALGDTHYLDIALRNAEFIEREMVNKAGGLFRNYKDGQVSVEAFLDDYAFLADAYCTMYKATFDKLWLNKALLLVDTAKAHFQDENTGLFFYASDKATDLITRKINFVDNEMPSGNAVLAGVCYQLGYYFDREDYRKLSREMITKVQPLFVKGTVYFGRWMTLLGTMSHKPYEIAILGPKAKLLAKELQTNYLPTGIVMGGDSEDLPLLEDKLFSDQTLIYVCQNETCQAPVETVAEALAYTK